MKVLVLGGTGVMGRYLTHLLSDSENEVVVTSRNLIKSSGNVSYRKGNAKDLAFLNELIVDKWDVIVDFMIYTLPEFQERVDALLSATSHYVFLSSARVYDNSSTPLKESSPRLLDTSTDKEYLATDEYALLKAKQENLLVSLPEKNWTIIRPYITYSEVRLQLGTLEKENWLYRALNRKTIVFSEEISNSTTTLTYGLNVVESMIRLLGCPQSFGEIFHITSDKSHKWKDILSLYLDVLETRIGYRPKVVFQSLDEYVECNSGKYQVIYDRTFNREFNNTKIKSVVGNIHFHEAEVGIVKSLTDFLKDPKFKPINWKLEATKDRYTRESTPLSEIKGIKQKLNYLLFRYLITF
tara:strand:- start:264 stop:1325 length:1062 start_codon:yes stop_codon:yes gene_type:complete